MIPIRFMLHKKLEYFHILPDIHVWRIFTILKSGIYSLKIIFMSLRKHLISHAFQFELLTKLKRIHFQIDWNETFSQYTCMLVFIHVLRISSHDLIGKLALTFTNELAGPSEGHKPEPGEDDSPGQNWDPPQVLQSETGRYSHQEPAVQHSAPVGEDRVSQRGANQAPREGLQGGQTGEGQ